MRVLQSVAACLTAATADALLSETIPRNKEPQVALMESSAGRQRASSLPSTSNEAASLALEHIAASCAVLSDVMDNFKYFRGKLDEMEVLQGTVNGQFQTHTERLEVALQLQREVICRLTERCDRLDTQELEERLEIQRQTILRLDNKCQRLERREEVHIATISQLEQLFAIQHMLIVRSQSTPLCDSDSESHSGSESNSSENQSMEESGSETSSEASRAVSSIGLELLDEDDIAYLLQEQ
uniref:Uncharacterized protein n=1 Tax=Mycena chlorophos TaxID=658473 RepID=A0ABQ0KUG8_MYCCL|nr:predicted protein [Mycena chlorophos]